MRSQRFEALDDNSESAYNARPWSIVLKQSEQQSVFPQVEINRLQSDLAKSQEENMRMQQRFSDQLAASQNALDRTLRENKSQISRLRDEHQAAILHQEDEHQKAVENILSQRRQVEV